MQPDTQIINKSPTEHRTKLLTTQPITIKNLITRISVTVSSGISAWLWISQQLSECLAVQGLWPAVNAVHIDNPVIGPGAAVEDDVSWALLVQRFSEIDGAVLWNVNTAGRCTHTGKTVVQSTQLWEAERCLLCVCVWGGGVLGGGRENVSHASMLHWEDGRCGGGGEE